MATAANVSSLLRVCSARQKSAVLNYYDFCDFVKEYSKRHVEEQSDLVKYLGTSEPIIRAELEELQKNNQAAVIDNGQNKKFIIAISFFVNQYAQLYKNISANPAIPFPKITDLPKKIPTNIIQKENAADFIPKLLESQDLKSQQLYCIVLPHEIPSILFPECVPINYLTDTSFVKIKNILKKDETHDYFLRKLKSTNHGKEISVQNFFRDFENNQRVAADYIENNMEYFYLLSQLCYFIRMDFTKVKDMTTEDENVLQSVVIAELQLSYLKTKLQQKQIKEEALKELEANIRKPPYFYTLDSIYRFTDTYGNTLYGQYGEEDLREYLTKETKATVDGDLPSLLVFETEKSKYFIHKTNVFPLVLRLCNEVREKINADLVDEWSDLLLNFEKVPEMKNNKAFNDKLKEMVEEKSPMLYSILNSAFLPVLHYEILDETSEASLRLFSNSTLLPYSEILMLQESTILANAKMRLPFWYSLPIIPFIMSLFRNGQNEKNKEKKDTTESVESDKFGKNSREAELSKAAKVLQSHLIPEGSTIDRELESYESQWNRLISKDAHKQLTQDVNSFIRDYLKKAARTFSGQSLTVNRIDGLADTLMNAPNMKKIGHPTALKMYVKLYMLRLLGNF